MSDLLIATLTLVAFAFICGALLGYASIRFRVEGNPLAEQINQVLPQTQCGQCGYPGCKPYAQAIAEQGEKINRCPPGGEAGIKALAELLETDVIPLDESCGEEALPTVAIIREDECIGCTKCIQACPVDAIVGAAKLMHTVIESECTGCDLCVPPCPVDCIDMVTVQQGIGQWVWPKPQLIAKRNTENNIPFKMIDEA
ncbi:MAG: electron transport complex subunit RsxB [Gammaproteobacteria bacterium]|nr:electron transport complex subunit RsxB [Gammaproteobacteria bacterium]MDH5628997.1 electron transport complex subunit RsxB [Gammaproteobacteria bacterium]